MEHWLSAHEAEGSICTMAERKQKVRKQGDNGEQSTYDPWDEGKRVNIYLGAGKGKNEGH